MTTVLRALPLLALIAAGSGAVAAPSAADVSVTPPAGGGFVVKNNAGNATRLRVTEGGEVYLPNLPNTSEAGNVACYDGNGRLAKCASSALPSGGLPWARSQSTAPAGTSIPLLSTTTPTQVGVGVTTGHAGNYLVHWMVTVVTPLVGNVAVTCGLYVAPGLTDVDQTLVPGSETLAQLNQVSPPAVQSIHGSALATSVAANYHIRPMCTPGNAGPTVMGARIVVQEVGDAQASTIP